MKIDHVHLSILVSSLVRHLKPKKSNHMHKSREKSAVLVVKRRVLILIMDSDRNLLMNRDHYVMID